ncbi:M16 family metallopeptidase [Azospirillum sp. ST 5-10]|uniref:M16 family metallopeptidase n=1 Tax=unclassified Azospirillum TaxID=2630922 RepID=UPI003F4A33FC
MNSVRITTLGNGLRVATDTMPGVQTVSLGCWVGVGTRNEAAAVNGVAHLVEHMLFKGTERRSAYRISEEIEDVGGQLNAYTTREHTAYYAKVLHEDTALALDIIADMLQHSVLDEEELVRERTVVLQEIGQAADTPDDIIFDHFQATAFPGQAIGRPVLGSAEIVGALPRAALVDYVGRHYSGPSIVLSAAGRIDHDRFVALAEKAFAHLPSTPLPEVEPARYAGGDFREERDLEQLHVVLGFDGVGVHDPDFYAHSVLSTLLGGGMSSRLFQEVREKRGLVYSIYSFSGGYRDGGVFGVYAGTGDQEVTELIPVVCEEIRKVGDAVSADEVARARAQLKAGTLMALESSMSRCEQLGQQLLTYGRPVPVEEIVARIDAVDCDSVGRVARRLRCSRPTVTALGPLARLESYDRIAARLA